MAEEDFQINIVAKANMEGAREAAANIDQVAAATEKAAQSAKKASAANAEYAAQLTGSGQSAMANAVKQINEAEERRNSLISQRQAIIETETERLEALAAGDKKRADVLAGEVEMRKEAYQIQMASTLSDEESMALAQTRYAQREAINRQAQVEAELTRQISEAQEALNAQLVEEEAIRLRNAELAGAEGEGALAGAGFAARRGLGSMLGIGVRGLAGGLPQIAAFIAFSEIIRTVTGELKTAKKEAEETAKAQEAAAKATMERFKALGDAAKASLGEAKAEAEALTKTLDELAGTAEKSRARLDKLGDAKAQYDAAMVDQKEAEAMAGAKDDVERAKIKADADRERATIKARAEAEKIVREQKGTEGDLANVIGSRDEGAARVGAARQADATAQGVLSERKSDYLTSNRVRIEAEAAARAADTPDRVRSQEADFKYREAVKAAEAAREREKASLLNLDEATEKATATGQRVAELAATLDSLNAKVKEAQEKAQIAKYKADAQTIKSGLESGNVDKAGDEAVQAAKRKQDEELAREKDRQTKADVAVSEEQKRALEGDIRALEELLKQSGGGRLVGPGGAPMAGAGFTGAFMGAVPLGFGTRGSVNGHDGLASGGLRSGHVQGAQSTPTDFDKAKQFQIQGLTPGSGTNFKDAFRFQIDTRTAHQRNIDEAINGVSSANSDPAQAVIRDAENFLRNPNSKDAEKEKMMELLKRLIQHAEKGVGADGKQMQELEQLKHKMDQIEGQLRNNLQ